MFLNPPTCLPRPDATTQLEPLSKGQLFGYQTPSQWDGRKYAVTDKPGGNVAHTALTGICMPGTYDTDCNQGSGATFINVRYASAPVTQDHCVSYDDKTNSCPLNHVVVASGMSGGDPLMIDETGAMHHTAAYCAPLKDSYIMDYENSQRVMVGNGAFSSFQSTDNNFTPCPNNTYVTAFCNNDQDNACGQGNRAWTECTSIIATDLYFTPLTNSEYDLNALVTPSSNNPGNMCNPNGTFGNGSTPSTVTIALTCSDNNCDANSSITWGSEGKNFVVNPAFVLQIDEANNNDQQTAHFTQTGTDVAWTFSCIQ
jgi:hypothetical protein